jgi:hypothetical protein
MGFDAHLKPQQHQLHSGDQAMTVSEAQREVRSVFLGGAVGQLITGAIWLVSAALSTFAGPPPGILALVFGGMLIFPLTRLALKLIGGPGALSRENPLNPLPLQSVFAMAAMYPLIYVAARCNLSWFYPAFMIVVGAHYISFIFLYGMWQYGALAATLIGSGVAVGLLWPNVFDLGGWLTSGALVLFALIIWRTKVWKQPQLAHYTQ